MSKKKKNKKYKKTLYFETKNKKNKNKKNKAAKTQDYRKPKKKTVHNNLSKKEIKWFEKQMKKAPKADKKLLDQQAKCNHAGDNIYTLAEFREVATNPEVYSTRIDVLVDTFGEENVFICGNCGTPLINPKKIDMGMISKALAVLHGAETAIVSRQKMKDKEVQKMNEIAVNLSEWNAIAAQFHNMDAKGAFDTDAEANNSDLAMTRTTGAVPSSTGTAFVVQ